MSRICYIKRFYGLYMSIQNLEDLKKIERDIESLESLIRNKESSLKYLSSVRKGENMDTNIVRMDQCVSHYKNHVDTETQTMLSKYIKSFESDIVRTCEMRVESQIRGMKTKLRILKSHLSEFFND